MSGTSGAPYWQKTHHWTSVVPLVPQDRKERASARDHRRRIVQAPRLFFRNHPCLKKAVRYETKK